MAGQKWLFSRNRMVLWGFVAVSLLFFLVFYDDTDFKRGLSANKAGSYIEGLKIVSKKNGIDSWVLTARRADFTTDETLARMNSVAMDIKKEGVLVNAESGIYNMNTKVLSLENNVILRTKDSVIHTNNLLWNPSAGVLTSTGKVEMEGRKFRLEGEELSATEDSKVMLMKDVRATFF